MIIFIFYFVCFQYLKMGYSKQPKKDFLCCWDSKVLFKHFSPHNLFFLFCHCSYLKKLPPWLACGPLAPSLWGWAQQAEGLGGGEKKKCLFPMWPFYEIRFGHLKRLARNIAENSRFYPTCNAPIKNPNWVFWTGGKNGRLKRADRFDVYWVD